MTASFTQILAAPDRPDIELVITPVTPYFICDHYFATEIHTASPRFIGLHLQLEANDLLRNKNYSAINDLDIVQVQVDHLDFFCQFVLPLIAKRDIRIVVITSQWNLPQVNPDWPLRHICDRTAVGHLIRRKRLNIQQIFRYTPGEAHSLASMYALTGMLLQELPRLHSRRAGMMLDHPNVALWISQNPIYFRHPKYLPFPFGIRHTNLDRYMRFARTNHATAKTCRMANLYATVHSHLAAGHVRATHPIFGVNSGLCMQYEDFLEKIAAAEFVVSTPGDRADCYRHYECIGLNAIPVSTIGREYEAIFGEDMLRMHADQLEQMLLNDASGFVYHSPNRDILAVDFWRNTIRSRLCNQRERLAGEVTFSPFLE